MNDWIKTSQTHHAKMFLVGSDINLRQLGNRKVSRKRIHRWHNAHL